MTWTDMPEREWVDSTARWLTWTGETDPVRRLAALEARIPRSDQNSAELLSELFAGRVTYSSVVHWRVYNDELGVHQEDDAGVVDRYPTRWAKAVSAALHEAAELHTQHELRAGTPPDRIEKKWKQLFGAHAAYRDKMFSNRGHDSLLKQLRIVLRVSEAAFDRHKHLVVCRNGVLDLNAFRRHDAEEKVLLPHSREHMATKSLGCAYEPVDERGGSGDEWERYITRSLPNPALRRYLQTLAGTALLGDPQDKVFVNLIGPGSSGKSVFVNTMLDVFHTYGHASPVEVFLATTSNTEFMRNGIKGKRFVGTSEPRKGARWNDDVVKSLSGRDVQTTSAKHQPATSWKPECVIFLASNQEVRFDTEDTALLDRLKPIRFPVQFVDPRRVPDADPTRWMDRRLERKLADELPDVLNWLLEGIYTYDVDGGLVEPAEVEATRQEMVVNVEPIWQWVQESVEDGLLVVLPPDGPEPVLKESAALTDLYRAYELWAGSRGIQPGTQTRLTQTLNSRHGPRRVGANRTGSGTRVMPYLRWSAAGQQRIDINRTGV